MIAYSADKPWTQKAIEVVNGMRMRFGWPLARAWIVLLVVEIGAALIQRMDFFPAKLPATWMTVVFIECLNGSLLVLAILLADQIVELGASRLLTYSIAVVACSALAAWLQWELRPLLGLRILADSPGAPSTARAAQPLFRFFDGGLWNACIVGVYVYRRSTIRSGERMRNANLAREEARRGALQSRLLAMQARVEPQFLFNTLSRVEELYELDRAVAAGLLDDLIAYLRAALPHLRERSSTLGQESDLVLAYLGIMRARSAAALDFSVDVTAGSRDVPLPPMVLLPLVEHALAHIPTALPRAGSIAVEASVGDNELRVSIRCSGEGFTAAHAQDLGDVTERLHALYDDRATLSLASLGNDGSQALLRIPLEP